MDSIPCLPGEEWRKADTPSGIHRVSNLGRVWSTKRQKLVRLQRREGYHAISVVLPDGKIRSRSVHRLVATAFIPQTDEECLLYPEVNHKDGVRTNNHISNLEWVNRQQNAQHAHDTGLQVACGPRGERCSHSKLTEAQVREIRALKGVEIYRVLAERYGVTFGAISNIMARRTWWYVSDETDGNGQGS